MFNYYDIPYYKYIQNFPSLTEWHFNLVNIKQYGSTV